MVSFRASSLISLGDVSNIFTCTLCWLTVQLVSLLWFLTHSQQCCSYSLLSICLSNIFHIFNHNHFEVVYVYFDVCISQVKMFSAGVTFWIMIIYKWWPPCQAIRLMSPRGSNVARGHRPKVTLLVRGDIGHDKGHWPYHLTHKVGIDHTTLNVFHRQPY